MNDIPRQKLIEIIAQHGPNICDDSCRLEGLLRDFCGEHKREIFVLVSALKEHVVADLAPHSIRFPWNTVVVRLTERLRDNLGLSEESARWAVESWALALGTVNDVELLTLIAPTTQGSGTHPNLAPVSPPSNTTRVNPVDGAEMIWVPAGDFLMGDDDVPDNPRRTVTVSGYWIYKNVVTVGMYGRFCLDTGAKMPSPPYFNGNWSKKNHPIVKVTWYEAQTYCRWAGVSLPSEAQWEKAARSVDGRRFPWGDTFDADKLWCSVSVTRDGTANVGDFGVSPYGCTDMAGNVWQWCADYCDDSYRQSSRSVDLRGPVSGRTRVLRGGSWSPQAQPLRRYYLSAYEFRSSSRNESGPNGRVDVIGFRCATTP